MKNLFFLILIFSFILTGPAFAVETEKKCQYDITGCVAQICENHLNFWCRRSLDNRLEVTRACAQNYGGRCVKKVCQHLGRECTRGPQNVLAVARACRGNASTKCIDYHCKNSKCHHLDTVLTIARTCGSAF